MTANIHSVIEYSIVENYFERLAKADLPEIDIPWHLDLERFDVEDLARWNGKRVFVEKFCSLGGDCLYIQFVADSGCVPLIVRGMCCFSKREIKHPYDMPLHIKESQTHRYGVLLVSKDAKVIANKLGQFVKAVK